MVIACAALFVAVRVPTAAALEIRKAGTITVPAGSSILAFSTDPTVAQVLGQDLGAMHRGSAESNRTPLTLTVNVSQEPLKPGVSLNQLAPGDPQVANLIREAGATPPPIGDTGDKHLDPYSEAARRQIMDPDNPTLALQNYESFKNEARRPEGPRFGPNGNASDEQIYDRAVVARASVGGSPDQMIALIVVHPSEDLRSAKELLAEEIANSILH